MLLTVVAFVFCALVTAPLVLVPGLSAALEGSAAVAVAVSAGIAAVSLAAYLLASAALTRGVDRRSLADLGLRLDSRALLALLAGMGISLVVLLAAGLLETLTGWGRTAAPVEQPAVPLVLVIAMVLIRAFLLQGIGEEVLCRGYLMVSLRSRPVLAVLAAAVVFTLPHLLSSGGQQGLGERFLYLAIPFGFALAAGVLAVALRSVWAAIGIHGGLHVSYAVVAALGLGLDGPVMWIVIGTLYTVAAVLIGIRLPRSRWDEVRDRGPYARAVR